MDVVGVFVGSEVGFEEVGSCVGLEVVGVLVGSDVGFDVVGS